MQLAQTAKKVIVRDALTESHRVVACSHEEIREVKLLTRTLINHIRNKVTKADPSNDLGR